MGAGETKLLSGWGRYPVLACNVQTPSVIGEAAAVGAGPAIARGMGRAYGDASIAPGRTVITTRLDRLLAFDVATGTLTCEAGATLADIVTIFVPRGWFVPVTPGTKFVTVGGMIASDVHGKNHHGSGTFCEHVLWLDLALGDGTVLRCSRTKHPELFAATCGGMGLTGIILAAAFRMIVVETAWIRQRVERARNLDEAIALFERSLKVTYSVAWVDCLATGDDLGRSIVFLGEHARADEASAAPAPTRGAFRLPMDLPGFVLNRVSVQLLNDLYYFRQRPRSEQVPLNTYFYPLDGLLDWNRLYGRGGFVQYQCVMPLASSRDGLRALLLLAAREGNASFLAVLKRMGKQSFGYLSFPLEGYTLTLDFPATPPTFRLLERFDAIVAEHGGRLYLAKDACSAPAMVERGYDRLDAFRDARRRYGVDQRYASTLSQRLGL